MGNEIKFDAIKPAVLLKSNHKDAKPASSQPTKVDEESVTNNLGTIVNKLLAENSVPQPSPRVMELKAQVANQQYKVDFDKLAARLTHTILNTK
jgi:anti-sigma28 factor (negative regulator of flagellin synthesis)